jgi:uncharacterized membrane protein YfcA
MNFQSLQFDFYPIAMAMVIFAIAAIYSAIGQGGGTGYLAVMAVGGLTPVEMRPTALALNILVSALAGWKFARAGRFSSSVFWPTVLAGAPCAMIGSWIDLPPRVYQTMVGIVLFYAAERLFKSSGLIKQSETTDVVHPNILYLSMTGALIGLISGLTGIGGGIFLSPVLVLGGWVSARNAAGTSALFTLANSIVGMAVVSSRAGSLPGGLWIWLVSAGLGAWIGSGIGIHGLSERAARRLLALVLCLAAMRSLWAVLT